MLSFPPTAFPETAATTASVNPPTPNVIDSTCSEACHKIQLCSDTSLNKPTAGSTTPVLAKKADHIQSEQKRRANIRRGYEALCETFPALREAVREEEEDIQWAAALAAAGLANGGLKGKAPGKKRAAKKKEVEEGGNGSGAKDKINGQAGPRSDNVVLSKMIDYVNELLSESANLLAQLQKAQPALPPGVLPSLSANNSPRHCASQSFRLLPQDIVLLLHWCQRIPLAVQLQVLHRLSFPHLPSSKEQHLFDPSESPFSLATRGGRLASRARNPNPPSALPPSQ
ncbi:hypothetical protein H1R20_g4994, partial [Candolleomyces eurysporus]